MRISSEVRKKTVDKFTNLLDGKVRPGVSVSQILDFVEGHGHETRMPKGNIEQCFEEEYINSLDPPDDFLH